MAGTIEVTADDQGRESKMGEGSLTFGRPVFNVTSGRTCANYDDNYDNCLLYTSPSPRDRG